MDLRILERIKELKQRLSHLRCQRNDATNRIGIEAIEQELTRIAAQLPREWDLVSSQAIIAGIAAEGSPGSETSFSEDDQVGSPWWP
jgi:hypothetical protein